MLRYCHTVYIMLLSIKYKFLFVHIAKTGGTSVRTSLQSLRWRDPWYYPMFLCSRFSHLSGHRIGSKFPRHSKIIAAKEMLPAEFFDSLFKFSFVRNPWDLQVSSFHHIKRERPNFLFGHDDFESFMRFKFDPHREYQFHIDTSLQLQSDYLVDLHGNILVDFIGKYESLQDDFSQACERIGIKDITLPHKREAKDRKKDYRSYYTDETAELVAKHFEQDIRLLNYQFDR
jgi:hypothetical protein